MNTICIIRHCAHEATRMEAVWSHQSEEDNDQAERNPNAVYPMSKDDEGLNILYVIRSSVWWWVIEV